MYLTLLFWFFFLIWKTFPFRFGLMRQTINEVPIVAAMPLIIVIFAVEKFLRIVSAHALTISVLPDACQKWKDATVQCADNLVL